MLLSKVYLVAWDEVISNSKDISNQLSLGKVEHVVYNVSNTKNQTSSWHTADRVRYYGHFFNAVRDFLSTDYDVFTFNAGDIVYDQYAKYTKRIETLFSENPNLALFSPNSTNDAYSGSGSLIESSRKYPELYLATNTDGNYVSMTREMASYMQAFYDWSVKTKTIDFSTMYSGWGLDYSYCALALYLNKTIYRDSSITVLHPIGSTYEYSSAVQECYKTMRAFTKFASETLGVDSERLRYIMNTTLGKIKRFDENPLGKEAMYTDLEAVRDA